MGALSRLRTLSLAEYDSLSPEEHVAVLDAAELLDELRPRGFRFALGAGGALQVLPGPQATSVDRARLTALADALVYVLRAQRAARGHDVEQAGPAGPAGRAA